MEEEYEQEATNTETINFATESNISISGSDNLDHGNLNDGSSDSSEQPANKDEPGNSTMASRRPRPDAASRNRKLKVKNDTSHRDIEKRRRDRINRSLWMLKDLVPAAKNRYGSKSGRLEKAELLELTVEYLRLLNKDNGGESPFSVITPLKSEEDQEVESGSPGLALPQDLYIAGFKDGVLEVLSQLKKNSFLTDFQAQDIVSRVHARDCEGNMFNVAQATGVMDALGLSYDVEGQAVKLGKGIENEKEDCSKAVDVDSGCQGISDEDVKHKIPPPTLLRRKRRQNALENYETDSLSSSDNSSERSCGQRLSPKRPYLSSSNEESSSSCRDKAMSESLKKFPHVFENFPANSALAASHGSPLLLPAYALHASGTHYVPIVIQPSAVFSQSLQTESLKEGAVVARSRCQERFEECGQVGQPPVLVRSGDPLHQSHEKYNGNRGSMKESGSDQERRHSVSSAPTSVISLSKSSDSNSDEEVDRCTLPLRGSCVPSDKRCSPRSKGGVENSSETTEQKHHHFERAIKRDELDRSRPVFPVEYRGAPPEQYNPYLESHTGFGGSSLLHYWQSRYSHKGLYH